jgi:hypothetical protein
MNYKMNKVRAVVLNNEVLGLMNEVGDSIEPLCDLRSFVTTNHTCPIMTFNDKDVRTASLEDFKRFRIQYSESYLII